MMERKQALTIPFAAENDKLMENPFRIPTLYLEGGRLQRQVSWAAIAGYKSRQHDSQHKNGSVLLDHSDAAMIRRKPCLILTDVLKTEVGKDYMERIKQRLNLNWKERGCGTDYPVVSRRSQTKASYMKCKSVIPKLTPNSPSSHRSRLKTTGTVEKDDDKQDNKVEKSEVVDCGLSVSWEDADGCKLSPTKINKWKEPQNSFQKRKIHESVPEYTETNSPKRPRESLLSLSGAKNRDGEPALGKCGGICPEESAEIGNLENLECGFVQFTVGEEDKDTEPVIPFIYESQSTPGSPQQMLSHDDNAATADPIVLSSDDEDGDKNIVQPISQRAVFTQKKAEDMELVLNEHTDSAKGTCLCLAFSTLYCGRYQAKTNGDLLITDENIIIPLKDTCDQMDLMLTMERKALRQYSVWEQHELEALNLFSKGHEEPLPAAGLLCCVSESAAMGVQYDLIELCDQQDRSESTEKPSPFILIFLREPLKGVEGAYLRSLLDIDCLSSAQEKSMGNYEPTIFAPVLSLEESLELIKTSGLDPHLLMFLGQGSTSTDQDCRLQDSLENTSCTEPGTEQKEFVVKVDEEPKHKMPSQLEEADQPQENCEKSILEPVYTLCHRRLKDGYSVTICKSDSSWVKYKHQGLVRRLIQFPPPPLKGGITVTIEDLQCLDSGHYLNDVIIDFYLKYLLQNASESVAGRSHIFSSFFYKQLTRRDNASEGGSSESCQRQKRYQRVRTWTRHVDIFTKDFLFVPVNQEAHWYLVVICFPGLEEPKTETWPCAKTDKPQHQNEPQGSESPNDNKDGSPTINKSDSTETENSQEATKEPPPGQVNCTEQTCQRKTICKRPCILVMDSLKRSPHERVSKLLREYLQSEWEARRGSSRDFGADQMECSHCQVPLQDNSTDCGLYLLQYVESFLKDPVAHFDLPLHLKFWFTRHQVRSKRDEIRNLVLRLYRLQNVASKS